MQKYYYINCIVNNNFAHCIEFILLCIIESYIRHNNLIPLLKKILNLFSFVRKNYYYYYYYR